MVNWHMPFFPCSTLITAMFVSISLHEPAGDERYAVLQVHFVFVQTFVHLLYVWSWNHERTVFSLCDALPPFHMDARPCTSHLQSSQKFCLHARIFGHHEAISLAIEQRAHMSMSLDIHQHASTPPFRN